jgi:hypothetical protein
MQHHATESRYQLRIELKYIRPKIWREIIVPESVSLAWLHEIIQEAMMGWIDTHMHEFEHHRKHFARPEEEDFEGVIDESTVALNQLLRKKGDQLTYTYDFGDSWAHLVRLEKILPPDPENLLRCVAGERDCPPEDCGGPPGYEELIELRAAAGKGEQLSEEEAEYLEHYEFMLDDDVFDEEDVNEINLIFAKMLAHAMDAGGMNPGGAEAYGDGIFKPHELDDFEDFDDLEEGEKEEFQDFLKTLADPAAQKELERLENPASPKIADDEEELPEPYGDLSAADQDLFHEALVLAQSLRALEPWKKLCDSDIFGIEDPELGEVALVSVLGANKEVFALQVHRAPHGFSFWKQVIENPQEISREWILHNSSIIEAEFKNKGELEKPDLDLYKITNAQTPGRGRKQWTEFRNYRPRAMPWFPKALHLPLLIRGMRLLPRYLELMEQSSQPEDFCRSSGPVAGLPKKLKTFQLQPGGDRQDPGSWMLNDVPVDWESCGYKEAPPYQPLEFEVQRLAKLPRIDALWQLGAIYFSNSVMTAEGPILPIVALAADPSQAIPPMPFISDDLEASPTEVVWNCLKERALQVDALPSEIHVRTEAAATTLQPLAELSGIRIVLQEKLDFLDALFESLASMPPP